jgi:hypothetical protein
LKWGSGRGGDHDRRHFASALAQFGQEFETVHSGHLIVDYQTTDVGIVIEEGGVARVVEI